MHTHQITLPGGYKSPDPKDKGAVGRLVTFGRRPTVSDRIKIDADAQSSVEVQEALLYARASITSFEGARRTPVPLSALLSLDDTDREVLLEGYIDFLRASLDERTAEQVDEDSFGLAVGLEVEGETYDVIEFTRDPQPLTGYDEVKLEKEYGSGLRKQLALISRESVRLVQAVTGLTLEGPVDMQTLEGLDSYDGGMLLDFFMKRRDSFRKKRRADARAAEGRGAARETSAVDGGGAS